MISEMISESYTFITLKEKKIDENMMEKIKIYLAAYDNRISQRK